MKVFDSSLNITRNSLHLFENSPIFVLKKQLYRIFSSFKTYEEPSFAPASIYNNPNDRREFAQTLITKDIPSFVKGGYKNFLTLNRYSNKERPINPYTHDIHHSLVGVSFVEANSSPSTMLRGYSEKLRKNLFAQDRYVSFKDEMDKQAVDFEFGINNISMSGEMVKFGSVSKTDVVFFKGGVIKPDIIKHLRVNERAYIFEIDLDRLALIMYNIPDIKLLWTADMSSRIHNRTTYIPKDIPEENRQTLSFKALKGFSYEQLYETIRKYSEHRISRVKFEREFKNQHTGQTWVHFEVTYECYGSDHTKIIHSFTKLKQKLKEECNIEYSF